MVISGEMPTSISMGTSTGASSAHLALAEPMNRLSTAPNRMIEAISSVSGMLELSSTAAPWIAKIRPRFDQLNMATKCAAAKASTR